jgi:hypothetical protein
MKILNTTFALSCLLLTPCGLIHAGIYGTVGVSAGDPLQCSQGASGSSGSVSCSASGFGLGTEQYANASASFNGFSFNLSVDDGPDFYEGASASASITTEEWVVILGGSGSGTLTGTYSYFSENLDEFGEFPFQMPYSISQGDGEYSGYAVGETGRRITPSCNERCTVFQKNTVW